MGLCLNALNESKYIDKIAKIIYEDVLKGSIPKVSESFSVNKRLKLVDEIQDEMLLVLQNKIDQIRPDLKIRRFNLSNLNYIYHQKVLPFVTSSSAEALVKSKIENELRNVLTELPF